MRKSEISVSMMCANLANLVESVRIFEKNGIEYLHIDVMDGAFVPNFGLGVDYIRGLRELTNIPFDLHLMINNPEYKLRWLGLRDTDIVTIHCESTQHLQRALDRLKEYGCRRFVAINPATPVSILEEVLDDIDGINLLMVNPGFAGQKIVPGALQKAQKLQAFLQSNKKNDLAIEVDGNITPEHGHFLRGCGAGIFVAGTSSIFKGGVEMLEENIAVLRAAIA